MARYLSLDNDECWVWAAATEGAVFPFPRLKIFLLLGNLWSTRTHSNVSWFLKFVWSDEISLHRSDVRGPDCDNIGQGFDCRIFDINWKKTFVTLNEENI